MFFPQFHRHCCDQLVTAQVSPLLLHFIDSGDACHQLKTQVQAGSPVVTEILSCWVDAPSQTESSTRGMKKANNLTRRCRIYCAGDVNCLETLLTFVSLVEVCIINCYTLWALEETQATCQVPRSAWEDPEQCQGKRVLSSDNYKTDLQHFLNSLINMLYPTSLICTKRKYKNENSPFDWDYFLGLE